MTIATHEQQRDAVEAWARGRGFVMHDRTGSVWKEWTDRRWGVHTVLLPPRGTFLICPEGDELRGQEVSPAVALAWSLLVELGAGSVDVGRCPAGESCGEQTESIGAGMSNAHTYEADKRRQGWTVTRTMETGPGIAYGSRYRLTCTRPCPDCNGTSRETEPIARALLSDDAKVRACLHAEADRLLAANDPVGMALAWGLRWSEGDGEQDGTGEAVMLLRWAKVAREQAERLLMMQAWAEVVAMGGVRPAPDTVVLSPEAYDRLTNTWTISITPAEEPAEIVSVTVGNSIADAIRPAIEAIGTSLLPMPAEIPEPIDERDRPKHARHIGPQLGRRLGVRAR
jgi:hypothetical protein